jgi:catechol-2,3-dioxygenase
MIIEPNVIVLYVDNLEISSQFYQDLLGKPPEESSETFHSFGLANGMSIGLKSKHAPIPGIEKNSNGELAFIVDNKKMLETLFESWQEKEINIVNAPSEVSYGYTFLAEDPDGTRLRVCLLNN